MTGWATVSKKRVQPRQSISSNLTTDRCGEPRPKEQAQLAAAPASIQMLSLRNIFQKFGISALGQFREQWAVLVSKDKSLLFTHFKVMCNCLILLWFCYWSYLSISLRLLKDSAQLHTQPDYQKYRATPIALFIYGWIFKMSHYSRCQFFGNLSVLLRYPNKTWKSELSCDYCGILKTLTILCSSLATLFAHIYFPSQSFISLNNVKMNNILFSYQLKGVSGEGKTGQLNVARHM